MPTGVRNALIVVAIAAAVYAIPSAGRTADFVYALLQVGIMASFAWIGLRLYLEHRVTIYSLGTGYRALLYAALAAGVFDMAARGKLLDTGAGTFAWFAIAGGATYSLYAVWRHFRTYA